MGNGHLLEGFIATLGSILLFIALREWLDNIGILSSYWWLLGIIGFIFLFFREKITDRIMGVGRG